MADDAGASQFPDAPSVEWMNVARKVCVDPALSQVCPTCGAETVRGEWNIVIATSREADVDLKCHSCSASARARIVLPASAPKFFPPTRVSVFCETAVQESAQIVK